MSASGGTRKRVVLIGAGFAGVKCAQILSKRADQLEIVMFNRDNHMVFQPLLADVAGSSLNPRAVAAPLRQLLPKVEVRTQEVNEVDAEKGEIVFEGHDGQPQRLGYDQLILSCGNQVNLNLLPGMAAHALPLKTIGDAISLRSKVMEQLEKASTADDAEVRRFYLSFIVIGGGFSGVEVAGEIGDLVENALRWYPRLKAEEIRVVLLHSGATLLPELNERLGKFAEARMRKHGIEVKLTSRAAEVSARGVVLKSGERLEGETVVCTIGTTPIPLIAKMDVAKERGRLLCDADMRLQGGGNIWAIGDCSAVPNAHSGSTSPPTAQFAERQGRQCAQNLIRAIDGQPTADFSFRAVGSACGIGGRRGVAELYGFRFSGFLAWWLWRSAFLVKLPSFLQKLKVGFDWAWELVFPRDVSHYRGRRTDPVQREHYSDGEVLLRKGSQRSDMIAIEDGDVEVMVRAGAEGDWRTEAKYGAGTLLGNTTFDAFEEAEVEIRAAGAASVVRLPAAVLGRMAEVLSPLDGIVQKAAARPERVIWRHHPAAMAALRERKVEELATYMAPVADLQTPLGAAYKELAQSRSPALFVTEQERFVGVATRSDFLATFSRGADRNSRLADACNRKAWCAQVGDNAAEVAEAMATQDLKLVPICDTDGRPVGAVSADDIVGFALGLAR